MRLFDFPDERKVHHCAVPRLGGMNVVVSVKQEDSTKNMQTITNIFVFMI